MKKRRLFLSRTSVREARMDETSRATMLDDALKLAQGFELQHEGEMYDVLMLVDRILVKPSAAVVSPDTADGETNDDE